MSDPCGARSGRSVGRGAGAGTARGQLSLSAVEAGIGVLFVLTVAATFGLGLPDAGTTEAQLDAYAEDAATVLANEPPRHAGETRLAEIAGDGGPGNATGLEREGAALERRLERILDDNLLYRVEVTGVGAVGHERPAGTPAGSASVLTRNGEVVIRVWYG